MLPLALLFLTRRLSNALPVSSSGLQHLCDLIGLPHITDLGHLPIRKMRKLYYLSSVSLLIINNILYFSHSGNNKLACD